MPIIFIFGLDLNLVWWYKDLSQVVVINNKFITQGFVTFLGVAGTTCITVVYFLTNDVYFLMAFYLGRLFPLICPL